MRISLISGIVGAGLAINSALALPALNKAPDTGVHRIQQCGWFAIYACSRSWQEARRYAEAEGGRAVDSSSPEFPNFRPGWYCAAFGPTSYDSAISYRARLRVRYPDAYVKNSC